MSFLIKKKILSCFPFKSTYKANAVFKHHILLICIFVQTCFTIQLEIINIGFDSRRILKIIILN